MEYIFIWLRQLMQEFSSRDDMCDSLFMFRWQIRQLRHTTIWASREQQSM